MMGGDAGAFIQLFPKGYINVILSLILQAGQTLQKKTDNEFENRITNRLCLKLIQNPIFRKGPLSIHPQRGILSLDSEDDTLEGQIDILISCEFGSETYFAIEAKRLRVFYEGGRIKTGNDEYVNNGMMRFVIGQYAPFMITGAMLGYVFDGEIEKARSGVDQYIQYKADDLLLLAPKCLTKSPILSEKPVDETHHDLKNGIFTIYHIFLPV